MIDIYHAPGTRSLRIIWLCEELRLPHRVIPVDFSADYRSSPEWRAKNPVGKVPVLVDGELTMFESGAMLQYLLDRYGEGRLQPRSGTAEHAIYLQWCWFAEATFARPLGEIVNHRRALPKDQQSAAAIEEMQARAWLCVEALDAALEGRTFLLGDAFTGADIMTGYSLMLADRFLPQRLPPRVAEYWADLASRPACAAALSHDN